MDALVELRDVSKQFPFQGKGSFTVLQSVSLKIVPEISVSITGESGSGKSTLLHLIGGLERPSSGHIFWKNRPIDRDSINQKAVLRRGFMSFVFQSANLIPELTVLENVLFALRILKNPIEKADKIRSQQLLEQLGIAHCANQIPEYLSGGERQRTAIARALITNPQILIADEPTGNLDEANARNVIALLRDLCRENHAALLLVTHNLAFTQLLDQSYRLCDHTLIVC
ncbi:MAG: ABC transporter ATP-binding protein [Verrucomicrobiota bacterium]|nr:MAG: ABC transporter ATP-binding protein [Verrucomicrobiota bacterium]